MITIDEPPLIRGTNYIILITILVALFTPIAAHEAFDNCCPPPAKSTWDSETIKEPLLVASKEFAPIIENKPIGYGNGSCVPYARAKTGIQLTGWAGSLLERAEDAGYATSTIPAQGGMVITDESNGHVAVVEEVKDDTIVISEQNYVGKYIVSSREIPMDDPIIQGYIHVSEIPTVTDSSPTTPGPELPESQEGL